MRKWELSRILQLLHAEGIYRGSLYQWRNFGEPSQELLDKLDTDSKAVDWNELEPQYAP
jgi:hypothetical protein